jgi:hypothetical protein
VPLAVSWDYGVPMNYISSQYDDGLDDGRPINRIYTILGSYEWAGLGRPATLKPRGLTGYRNDRLV